MGPGDYNEIESFWLFPGIKTETEHSYQAEQETRFLWSQNDTKHYSERLAMNFILTLKEQKSEGNLFPILFYTSYYDFWNRRNERDGWTLLPISSFSGMDLFPN